MTSHIKKLISYIDELLVWIRENPEISIPAREKERLKVIIQQLNSRKEISDEDWEKMKPKKEQDTSVVNYKLNREIKTALAQIKQREARQVAETKKALTNPKKTIPFPLKPVQSKKEITKRAEPVNAKGMTVCQNCKSPVSAKNLPKHRKKCKAITPNKAKQKQSKQIASSSKAKTSTITENIENKRLDGSRGYHALRREHGKFGSHSSYDNMDDNSKP